MRAALSLIVLIFSPIIIALFVIGVIEIKKTDDLE